MATNPEELENQTLTMLGQAMEMRLNLSEDDSVYDLHFISEKLALVGVFQERLSDIQMQLTQTAIEATRHYRALSASIRIAEKQAKASDHYANLPMNEKAFWLENQQTDLKGQVSRWNQLTAVVSEVRNAVTERTGTMKRLDSDLRLHARIYEAKVAAGATSPSSYRGNNTKEIDL
jgi:hypothetical protein